MFVKAVAFVCLIGFIQAAPWDPIPRNDANWLLEHERFVNNTQTKRGEINVLFYGDSITKGWSGAGKPVYDLEYEPLGTANYGIGGDKTENVLWRIMNGEVEGLEPKVVVLMIGTNNGGNTQDDVVKGITAIVEELKSRLPNSKILLLGILPRSNTSEWFSRIVDINIKIARLGDGKNVHFFEMFYRFVVGWAEVNPTFYNADKLHLVQAGYQKWADSIRVKFNQLLNA